VRPGLEAARIGGRSVVLGTLAHVEGSSPRPAGSQMLFDGARAEGYFSGGCLEADVANHAAEVLADGVARRLVYGQGSPWIDIRLLCGGRLEILLERIDPDDEAVSALLDLRRVRRPAHWHSDGKRRWIANEGAALQEEGSIYKRFDPPWRLVIVGGDPIALAAASLGSQAGFDTTMVRPHGPESGSPMPGVAYRREAAPDALTAIGLDPWTAVLSATHEDDVDDSALIAALSRDTGYVGVLGSIQRVSARRERLKRSGLDLAAIARLHAPVGAARCGKAPWEVAVSIMAEIMEARTMKDFGPFEEAWPELSEPQGST
jgi:xanthine dehydrogenase accessory factor